MRIVRLAAIAILAKAAQSQSLIDSLPSCAQPCVTSAISDADCDVTDQACICAANEALLVVMSGTCLLTSCSPSDINDTKDQYDAFCAAAASTTLHTSKTSTVRSSKSATPSKSAAPSTSTIISTSSTTSTTSQQTSAAAPSTSATSSQSLIVSQSSVTTPSSAPSDSPANASTEVATPIPQAAGNEGLTAGAKAGIGIGVASAVVIIALGAWLCLNLRRRRNNLQRQQDQEDSNVFSTKKGYEMMLSGSKSTFTVEITAGNPTQVQELDSRSLPFRLPRAQRNADVEREPTSRTLSGQVPISRAGTGSYVHEVEPVELDSRPINSAAVQHTSPMPSALVPAPWRWQHNHAPMADASSDTVSPVSAVEDKNAEDKLAILRKRVEKLRVNQEQLEKSQQFEGYGNGTDKG